MNDFKIDRQFAQKTGNSWVGDRSTESSATPRAQVRFRDDDYLVPSSELPFSLAQLQQLAPGLFALFVQPALALHAQQRADQVVTGLQSPPVQEKHQFTPPAKDSPLDHTLRGWSLNDIPVKPDASQDLDKVFSASLTNIGRAINADPNRQAEGAARFNAIRRDLAALKAENGGTLRGQVSWDLLDRLRDLGRDFEAGAK